SPQVLEAKFPQIIQKYVAGEIEKNFSQSYEEFQKAGNGYHYFLQPLKRIHLTSDLEAELRPNGSLQTVYIFAVIAVFILFIACINFINLSTARSMERAREVGMRKTFGSSRQSLVFQFLLESIILSLISILIAIGLIFLLLPLFNQLSGKNLSIINFLDPLHISMLFALAILVGLLAGLYPAFLLSSFKPIIVLKGRFKSNKVGLALRNGLVVFQFAISVILIICTIIVNQQMNYMLGEKLGFKKDHIIIIDRADLVDKQTVAFKNELLKIPGVETISSTSSMPGVQNFFGTTFQQVGSKESVTGRGLIVDDQYQRTLDLQLKEGRFFSKEYGTDTLAVVLNEKAAQELGLKKSLGARLNTPDPNFNAPDGMPYNYTVVGVLKDFHFQSLHQQITPLFITNAAKFGGVMGLMTVRIKGDNFKGALSSIEKTWQRFVEQHPLHYDFLDQTLAEQYHAEQSTQRIFTVFSILAIFIACLGLLGLAAYTTQQRTREISIRKVLGADIRNIVGMLTKDFLKLVALAALVAFPLAWWAMHQWLQDFAYRVNVAWWVFALSAIIAALIALFTISFQAIKAAITNPVKSLRTE
ncbi:MAG TPA: FtsX-like permease family protein, partial [Chitinophagaceae bacterium]|nr:FtsX-like permease family protein [Chitinophagaceae bacterium]